MSEDTGEFAFASERDAATKIRDAANAAGTALHLLPYSRFDPDRTTWWLSPEPANPAYAFGKVVVERPTIVDDGAKLIGLHLEKGVGPSAAPIFEESARGRHLVMQRNWTWHPFFRALRSGELEVSLREAEAAADGLPLVLEVVAALQPLPKLEDAEDRPVDPDAVERIRYRASDGALDLVASRRADRLGVLADRETLSSIGEKIAGIKDLDWAWVEVLIGVPFRPVTSGGLTAIEVWAHACIPWVRWIR